MSHPPPSTSTSPTPPFPLTQNSKPNGAGPLFLGLDVGLERLSATLLDVECKVVDELSVELDGMLPELGTRRGVFQHSGDEVVQPIELIIASLDCVLQLLQSRNDLSRVVAISSSSHSSLTLLTSNFPLTLASLDPNSSFHSQLCSSSSPNPSFAKSTILTPLDNSSLSSLNYFAVARNASTTPPTARPLFHTPAVQLLALPWKEAAAIRSVGSLIAGLLCGRLVGEDGSTVQGEWGMWDVARGGWDEDVLESIAVSAGLQESATNELKEKLGEVGFDGGKVLGKVSSYLAQRHGFSEECVVTSFTTSHLAVYLSLRPSDDDAVLFLGSVDALLVPSRDYRPSHQYQLYPHPAQAPDEEPRWIVSVSNRNGESARTFVRDFYSNSSWPIFNQLVSVVAAGGSIGLDDKLFSFISPSLEVHSAFGIVAPRGIVRFENGVAHDEYRDLRANPRCLLESQLLSFRTRYSSIATFLESPLGTIPPVVARRTALGLGFDHFSTKVLPTRVLLAGQLVESPACLSVMADIFNAPVFSYSSSSTTTGLSKPTENLSPAALGSAYKARWAHRRLTSTLTTTLLSFEEDLPFPSSASPPLPSSSSPLLQPSSTAALRRARSSSNLNSPVPTHPRALRLTPSRGNLNDTAAIGDVVGARSRTSSSSAGGDASESSNGEGRGGVGMVQLAQPDKDAHRAYNSLLPEWARLEEMFVKGLMH